MRKAAVSLLAVFVMFAAFALPSVSAAKGENRHEDSNEFFSVSIANLPDSVQAGATIRGSFTIHINPNADGTVSRKQVGFQVYTESDFGRALLRSSSRALPTGKTKTIPVTYTVSDKAKAGDTTILLSSDMDGHTLYLVHNLEITK